MITKLNAVGVVKMSEYEIVINEAYTDLFDCNYYFFNFRKFNTKLLTYHNKCSVCGDSISLAYCYIVKNLKISGLLDKDYKLRCCRCEKRGSRLCQNKN